LQATEPPPKYLLIDAESVPLLDVSGAYALEALHRELAQQGIELGIARAPYLTRVMLQRAGLNETIGANNLYQTIHAGTKNFRDNGSIQAEQVNEPPRD